MDIGFRIRSERERLGFTQADFAALGGASKNSQLSWEKGIAMPNAGVLACYAKAGADVLYILTGQRSQAVAEVELLPADERVLVDAYRRCPAQARQTLIQTAALLSAGLGDPTTGTPGKAQKVIHTGAGSVQVGVQTGGRNVVKNVRK